jgi:hypothetical protein
VRQCAICPVWIASSDRLCPYHEKVTAGLIGRAWAPPGLKKLSDVVLTDEDRELVAGLRALGADDVLVAQALAVKDWPGRRAA